MKIKNERRYIDLLKFIIYNTENAQVSKVRKSLHDYAEQQYASIKILSVNSLEELIKTHGTICLMDYDFYLKNFERLKKWKKKTHICFMFIAKNHYQMIEAVKSNPNDYCLLSPLKTDMLLMLLDYIREKIKSKVIAIKKAHNGEEIIEVNKLNYVNIVHRSLRFYMTYGKQIDSQTLRQSFYKEVQPMLKHTELYFMAPSLLVNLENIKELYPDHIIFKNGDITYYPKTQYEKLRTAWFEFHQI